MESREMERKMIIDSEFESLIPPLTEEEYKGLEESILAVGCRDALMCWGDVLVDGHNRYKICTEHNLLFTTIEREFADKDEAKLWIMKNQLSRRNLNDFQRIEITHKCEDAVKAKAKERQGTRTDVKEDIVLKSARSRDELASMAGVGHSTYEHAVEVLEKAPEPVVKAVRNDDLSINAGYEVTKMPEAERTEVAERIEKGEKPKDVVAEVRSRAGVTNKTYEKAVKVIEEAPEEVKEAVRKGDMSINQAYRHVKNKEKEAKREEVRNANIEKVKQISSPLEVQGLFQTIVIDPAWDYSEEGDNDAFGRIKPNYRTMSMEEIKALPIAQIADKNSHLYIWVTNRTLHKSFQLIELRGFRYITCLTWVKPHFGVGNYFRSQTEHVLFAVKGSQPLKRHDVGTWFNAPTGEHSEKPDKFYELIESCSYAPYIDIFGRKEREGWVVWGENT